MSAEEQIFSSELLEQRSKVQEEYIKLQALIDNQIWDRSFKWCWDANCVNNITDDIFTKSKRIREMDPEDIVGKDSVEIRFQMDNSESSQSYVSANSDVILEVEGSQRRVSFISYNSIIPGTQISPEAEVLESTYDVQGVKIPEHVRCGWESPKTPWL
jgi:hypothetical protein